MLDNISPEIENIIENLKETHPLKLYEQLIDNYDQYTSFYINKQLELDKNKISNPDYINSQEVIYNKALQELEEEIIKNPSILNTIDIKAEEARIKEEEAQKELEQREQELLKSITDIQKDYYNKVIQNFTIVPDKKDFFEKDEKLPIIKFKDELLEYIEVIPDLLDCYNKSIKAPGLEQKEEMGILIQGINNFFKKHEADNKARLKEEERLRKERLKNKEDTEIDTVDLDISENLSYNTPSSLRPKISAAEADAIETQKLQKDLTEQLDDINTRHVTFEQNNNLENDYEIETDFDEEIDESKLVYSLKNSSVDNLIKVSPDGHYQLGKEAINLTPTDSIPIDLMKVNTNSNFGELISNKIKDVYDYNKLAKNFMSNFFVTLKKAKGITPNKITSLSLIDNSVYVNGQELILSQMFGGPGYEDNALYMVWDFKNGYFKDLKNLRQLELSSAYVWKIKKDFDLSLKPEGTNQLTQILYNRYKGLNLIVLNGQEINRAQSDEIAYDTYEEELKEYKAELLSRLDNLYSTNGKRKATFTNILNEKYMNNKNTSNILKKPLASPIKTTFNTIKTIVGAPFSIFGWIRRKLVI